MGGVLFFFPQALPYLVSKLREIVTSALTLLGEEQHESDAFSDHVPLLALCATMLLDVGWVRPQYLAMNNTKMTFVSLKTEHPSGFP